MMRGLFAACLIGLLPSAALACGPDTDCMIGDRSYRIAMPEGVTAPGALVYAHGYRGSARGAMRNAGLRRVAHEMGLALIAVNGIDGSWDLPGTPSNVSETGDAEFAYYEAVLNHAATQFGIDRDNVVATGFSAGGMMTWNVVCHRSDLIRGAVPMSGTFWDPVPEGCETPSVSVVHIHGDNDSTVPLAGRPIGPGHQGDVAKALEMYGQHGGFGAEAAEQQGDMDCTMQRNGADQVLGFCAFAGGHSFRLENLRAGLEMLE